MNRRTLLTAAGTATITSLAGCASLFADNPESDASPSPTSAATSTPTGIQSDETPELDTLDDAVQALEAATAELQSVWPIDSTAALSPEQNQALQAHNGTGVLTHTNEAAPIIEDATADGSTYSSDDLRALELVMPVLNARNSYYAAVKVLFKRLETLSAQIESSGISQDLAEEIRANNRVASSTLAEEADAIEALEAHGTAPPLSNFSLSKFKMHNSTLTELHAPVSDIANGFYLGGLSLSGVQAVVAAKNAEAYDAALDRLSQTERIATDAENALSTSVQADVQLYADAVDLARCRNNAVLSFIDPARSALQQLQAGNTDAGESEWSGARNEYNSAADSCSP